LTAQDEPRAGKADKPDDAQSEEELEVDSDVEDADGQDANTAKQLRKKTAASTYDEVYYGRRGVARAATLHVRQRAQLSGAGSCVSVRGIWLPDRH
jgi:hypothetical protein